MKDILIPIVFMLVVLGIFYLWISSRNKERMALIEKGESADKIFGNPPKGTGKWLLNLGIFALGISLGILAGNLLANIGMNEEQAYPTAIFLFGGAALVVAYFVSRKINGND